MKKALYTGLDAPKRQDIEVIHAPLIKIIPKEAKEVASAFATIHDATHIVITSKSTVALAKEFLTQISAPFISVGKATTSHLEAIGIQHILTAKNECQEGIAELIDSMNLKNPIFFWPHSSLSRPVLSHYFKEKHYECIEFALYDTHFVRPEDPIDLQAIDEIYFTSPSCVEAFFHFFGPPPKHATLHFKGEVTKKHLEKLNLEKLVREKLTML